MRDELGERGFRQLAFDIKIFLGVPQDSSYLTLAALFGKL
jgi:hypothetical protein